jgi:hypothetical protein
MPGMNRQSSEQRFRMSLLFNTEPALQVTDLVAPGENPFDDDAFVLNWRAYLSEKQDIQAFYPAGLVLNRLTFGKGLLQIRELRTSGSAIAWFQDFNAEKLKVFSDIHQSIRWDCLRLIWDSERREFQAFNALEELGYKPVHAKVPPHYVVDLEGGWDHYLGTRSRNVRNNLKRAERSAAPLKPEIVPFSGDEGVERFFELLFEGHIRYWKSRTGVSYFEDPWERAFTREWARALHARNRLVMDALMLDGQIANLGMGIRAGEKLLCLFSLNMGLFSEKSPGIIALYRRIRLASEAGYRSLDLGFGSHHYKQQAATRRVERYEMLVPNPGSIRGQIYVKRLLHRLSRFTAKEAERHRVLMDR